MKPQAFAINMKESASMRFSPCDVESDLAGNPEGGRGEISRFGVETWDVVREDRTDARSTGSLDSRRAFALHVSEF